MNDMKVASIAWEKSAGEAMFEHAKKIEELWEQFVIGFENINRVVREERDKNSDNQCQYIDIRKWPNR